MRTASHSRNGESLRHLRKVTNAIGGSLDELAARKSRVRTGWWPEMQVLTVAIRDLEGKCWPKDELLARLNSLVGEVVGLFEDYHSDLELFIEDGMDRKIMNLLAELDSASLSAEEEFEDLYASMMRSRDKADVMSQDLALLKDSLQKAEYFERKHHSLDIENQKNKDLIGHLEITVAKLGDELTRREGLSHQLESSSIRLDRSERRCIELERLLAELTTDNEHLAKTASERLDAIEKLEERLGRFARRNDLLERENIARESELAEVSGNLDNHIKREVKDKQELEQIVAQSKSLADETDTRNKKLQEEVEHLRSDQQRVLAQTEEMRGLMELYKDKYKKERLVNRSTVGLE